MPHLRIIRESKNNGDFVLSTEGLSTMNEYELLLELHDSELLEEAERLLEYISNYVAMAKKPLRAGETMTYGYWLIKFDLGTRDFLEIWEYNAQATAFVKGASLAMQYWRDQHQVCANYGATFQPPRPDTLTVVSEGVFAGLAVQGVRYQSPNHMSGWWITTEMYDGQVTSLKREHTHHLTAARPDLARYLALPEGFRFDLSIGEDVWFDEQVAISYRRQPE